MIFIEPEQGVVQQEVGDLVAPVIVDQRAPVRMATLPGIGVLEEIGAVEPAETLRVLGKVARHPVVDHADAGLMAAVDEVAEFVGPAEATGGREQPQRLVAPRAIERMLRDRQHLDVREAHILDVGN